MRQMATFQKSATLMMALGGNSPVFDVQGSLQRLGGDKGLLADLIQFYDQDSPALLERLRMGVQTKCAEDVRYAAHALRGLVANFGAAALREQLLRLEEAAEQDRIEDTPEPLKRAQEEGLRLSAALSPYRREGH